MKDNHVFLMATDSLMADNFHFGFESNHIQSNDMQSDDMQSNQWISGVHHGMG
jgi:hypothetical protein